MLKNIFKKIKNLLWILIYSSDWAPQPNHLLLEVTDNCNLNCVMCRRKELGGQNLSIKEFKYILSQLPGLKEITIVGRGESFMNPDIYEMLKIGKSKNINFTIITNGTLLTENNIKEIPNNVRQIIISVDSPVPEKYEKIRRGGKFNLVIENIKNLRKLKKDIYIRINVVIMEENIEDLPKFSELANTIKIDEINLFNLKASDDFFAKKHGDNFKNLKQKLIELKNAANNKGIKIEAQPLFKKPTQCVSPWSSLRIFLNGDYYPCCAMGVATPIRKECYLGITINTPQQQYKMGNIFDGDFKKKWNGKDYKLLRKTVRDSHSNILLTPEELNKKRLETDLCKRFSYCKICLVRQNRF